MHTVVMPKMGDTMEEGKIVNWLKREGETVAKGDALAEIETEKVTIPVEAFAAGVLRKILVPAGESVAVGAPIAYTGAADEPLPAIAAGAPSSTAKTPAPSSQANAAPEQIAPRPVAQPASAEDHTRPQQQASVSSATSIAERPGTNGYSAAAPSTHERVFISPIARRIAAEHDIDITAIQGTGPNGRIIRDDVEAALTAQQTPAPAFQSAQPIAAATEGEEVRAVPLSNMRKTIARRLQQSMQTAPHFYLTVSVDATQLVALRASINDYTATQPQPMKVSVNDLIVKAVATAISRHPEVNVSFDNDRLLFKRRINIGVAVALEQGLIVPVVRDADKRGVLDVARETKRLIDAARANKLKPEDFQGGTFSISNLGMYDIESFTAVINPPESAILAIGGIVPTPVVHEGQVVVRDMMKMTLSIDHRALDGASAARFLQDLKRLLEQPLGMLL
ncbi:MAG: dihydrolipoamide acetyltransferase family protein [Ktedonobacterales bacterium]